MNMKSEENKKYGVIEKNLEPADNQIPTEILVHSGRSHADDVMAVLMMQQINPGILVTRTRDSSQIKQKLMEPNIIVADVGEGHYDHHQPNENLNDNHFYNGIRNDANKKAACGLVWDTWGHAVIDKWIEDKVVTLLPNETKITLFNQFRDFVLRPIEAKDVVAGHQHVPKEFILPDINGKLPNYEQESPISELILSIPEIWTPVVVSLPDQEAIFKEQLSKLQEIIKNYNPLSRSPFNLNPIVAALTRQNGELLRNIEFNHARNKTDQEIVNDYLRTEIQKLDSNIRIFSVPYECSMDMLKDTNIQVLLCLDQNRTEIQIRTTKLTIDQDLIEKLGILDSKYINPKLCVIKFSNYTGRQKGLEAAVKIGKAIVLENGSRNIDVGIDTTNIETTLKENPINFDH